MKFHHGQAILKLPNLPRGADLAQMIPDIFMAHRGIKTGYTVRTQPVQFYVFRYFFINLDKFNLYHRKKNNMYISQFSMKISTF